MAVSLDYMTSGTIEYGGRVLPYQDAEMKKAYMEDIEDRFSEIALELESDALSSNLENMKALREYLDVLNSHLSILTKPREEVVCEQERFIRHALCNLRIDRINEELIAVGEATDVGISEFSRCVSELSNAEEVSEKSYVPKV